MRTLHTMLRVTDLEKSITFYTELLGMRLMGRRRYPEGKFTLAFLGYNDETELELTYNWETNGYENGTGFGHIALEVEDLYDTCDHIKSHGGLVIRDPGPMKYGTTLLAFVEDPDGYRIKLVQAKEPPSPGASAEP